MGSVELKGFARAGVAAGFVTAAMWFAAPTAFADTIDVHPGAANAIQNAIDGAHEGDTLRIHSGNYPEAIDVDKALTLVGVGDARPVVNGQCNTHYVIETSHDGVTL